jgi:hypothetical protein
MLPAADGSPTEEAPVKKLRCVLIGHRWTRRRFEGETTLQCRRCGRIADARDAASASANLLGGG